MLNYDELPSWLVSLEPEDIAFLKKFVLFSGSIKDLSKDYNVTYPTMRIRLDKLIEKIKLYDKPIYDDPFIEKIKLLAVNDKMDLDTAKELIRDYRKVSKKA